MRIPTSAPPDVQLAFREVWQALDQVKPASKIINRDLQGKRIINAGDAVDPQDYVTKRQLPEPPAPFTGTVDTLIVNKVARVLGTLMLPRLTDGSSHHVILWVDASGNVTGVNDGAGTFAYNDAAVTVELGFGLRLHWVAASSSIGAPSDGVINVLNNAGTGFARLVLGPDTNTGIALTKNGTTLELRLGGGAGALIGLLASFLVLGADPGGGDLLRIGGGITASGQVTANGYTAAGSAGINFGPAAVASLTVKGGIVVAAS
jgi:hypothetical protein